MKRTLDEWTSTLRERGLPLTLAAGGEAMTLSPTLSAEVAEFATNRYEVGSVLGEGGMGIVRAGRQSSLRREVALKTVRDDARSDRARAKLLREAWVTGMLEHPNIVPIHDLDRDERGEPRIVLRRIDGSSWAELIRDGAAVERDFGESDLFEWNLRVFLEAARALAFAHSRGIVHRDFKPENVMIGRSGEIYVVDWGLSVSLEDDPDGCIPHARDATEVAGTPAYMAPEQWNANGTVDARTDVYLLGATLFEIVIGHPPHQGVSLPALAASAFEKPSLPTTVSRLLRDLIARSLDPHPQHRPASVEELRREVRGYLQHRSSIELTDEAEAAARAFEVVATTSPVQRVALHERFGAARFGFLQALREWPGNSVARTRLSAVVCRMIELELEDGDLAGANALVPDLGADHPELAARVRAAVEAAVQSEQALRAHQDLRLGARGRTAVALGFTSMITLWPLTRWAMHGFRDSMTTYAEQVGAVTVVLAVAIAMLRLAALPPTRWNHVLESVLVGVPLTQLAMLGLSALRGDPVESVTVVHFALWAAGSAVFVAAGVSLMGWAVVGYLVGGVVAASWPALRWPAHAVANAVLGLVAMRLAWRSGEARP